MEKLLILTWVSVELAGCGPEVRSVTLPFPPLRVRKKVRHVVWEEGLV